MNCITLDTVGQKPSKIAPPYEYSIDLFFKKVSSLLKATKISYPKMVLLLKFE